MSINEFLLKLQMWAMQDNVSFLKKRYVFFSGLVLYSFEFILRLIAVYFYPSTDPIAFENLNLSVVQVLILIVIIYSLTSIAFIYICTLLGVRNLYACMLLLGGIANLLPMLSDSQSYVRTGIGMFLFDIVLTFASVIAVAGLSLRLNRYFLQKPVHSAWP